MKLWNLMFSIFYWATLFVSVWVIVQTDWSNIGNLEIIKNVGLLGGLTYLGEFFNKESKPSSLTGRDGE